MAWFVHSSVYGLTSNNIYVHSTFHLIVKLFVEDMRDPGPSIMKKKPRKKPPLSAPFKSYKIAI